MKTNKYLPRPQRANLTEKSQMRLRLQTFVWILFTLFLYTQVTIAQDGKIFEKKLYSIPE